jgi:hypothetical protein
MTLSKDLHRLKKIMSDERIKEDYFSFDALKVGE